MTEDLSRPSLAAGILFLAVAVGSVVNQPGWGAGGWALGAVLGSIGVLLCANAFTHRET